MASLAQEIEKATAAAEAAKARLRKARQKQRAAEKRAADKAALDLGRALFAATDRDEATRTFKAWRSQAFPEGGERSETDLGTAHLEHRAEPCGTNALLAGTRLPETETKSRYGEADR